MTDSAPLPVGLRHKRDATISLLCEHFAQDHIQAEELERLIDLAHESRSVEDLDRLFQGLPVLRVATRAPTAAPSEVERHRTVVAIMGGTEIKGAWTPARTIRIVALMGGAVLDFRDVRLPPGRIEVQVLAVMGGVEIIVPPGLRVSSDGIGVMGGFEHGGSGSESSDDADSPWIRVTGLALMGGVEISERHPGESSGDARRRRKRKARSRGEDRIRRLPSEEGP